MRIAILGTGGIALGYAALLSETGHEPVLFSLSGKGDKDLKGRTIRATGALEYSFTCETTHDLQQALAGAEACIIATTANFHRSAMDQLAVHLSVGKRVLVSAELSLSGDYLVSKLDEVGKTNPVTVLGTTVLTGRRKVDAEVVVGIVRKSCKAAVASNCDTADEIFFWQSIFGDTFQAAPSRMWVLFSNLNPTVHAGNALCNFTRIENGEDWSNFAGITPGVARLSEALDAERVGVAASYDTSVPSLLGHYRTAFGFDDASSLSEITAELNKRRKGLPKGPKSIATRYVTEDIPFGLAFVEYLAQKKGIQTPTHSAIINTFDSLYGRSFRRENPFVGY